MTPRSSGSGFEVTGDDPAAVAEVEPEEGTLARRGVERLLDLLERDAAGRDVFDVRIMCDKVILAPDDGSVPGHVCKHGIVRLDPGER